MFLFFSETYGYGKPVYNAHAARPAYGYQHAQVYQPVYGYPLYGQVGYGYPSYGQPAYGYPTYGHQAYQAPYVQPSKPMYKEVEDNEEMKKED